MVRKKFPFYHYKDNFCYEREMFAHLQSNFFLEREKNWILIA